MQVQVGVQKIAQSNQTMSFFTFKLHMYLLLMFDKFPDVRWNPVFIGLKSSCVTSNCEMHFINCPVDALNNKY